MSPDIQVDRGDRRRIVLSTLWIFVMLNYLYCDVLTLMDPQVLPQILSGNLGFVEVTQEFLLGAAVLMEISIAMVLLSRVLKHAINRWVNIVAGAITTLVQLSTLFVGSGPTAYYTFFSVIEISGTAFIVWYAWKWRTDKT